MMAGTVREKPFAICPDRSIRRSTNITNTTLYAQRIDPYLISYLFMGVQYPLPRSQKVASTIYLSQINPVLTLTPYFFKILSNSPLILPWFFQVLSSLSILLPFPSFQAQISSSALPTLKRPKPMPFTHVRPSFTPTPTTNKIIVLYIVIFRFMDSK